MGWREQVAVLRFDSYMYDMWSYYVPRDLYGLPQHILSYHYPVESCQKGLQINCNKLRFRSLVYLARNR